MPRKARRAGKSENASAAATTATSGRNEDTTSKLASTNAQIAKTQISVDGIRREGHMILTKLEEQVANLDKMAEEYLDQGLIGHHCEALQMKDRTLETLRLTRKKLGLPADGTAPTAAIPTAAVTAQPAQPAQSAGAVVADAPRAAQQVDRAEKAAVGKAGSPAAPTKTTSRGAAPSDDANSGCASRAASTATASTASSAACTTEETRVAEEQKREERRQKEEELKETMEDLKRGEDEDLKQLEELQRRMDARRKREQEVKLKMNKLDEEVPLVAKDEGEVLGKAARTTAAAAAGVATAADGAWSMPATTGVEKPARYRWREAQDGIESNSATLEVREVFADARSLVVDISTTAIRISWPSAPSSGEGTERSNTLTVPLSFVTDSEACQVVRKKRTGELTLICPRVASMPKLGPVLADALAGADGLGFVDSFMAGGEADNMRNWFLELWKRGELQPGEVEGGDAAQINTDSLVSSEHKSKFRSDHYIYLEEEGIVTTLTSRLDRLVLHLTKEVHALKRVKLMRGRPMATVYAGKGSRYAPHFDAVGSDNGRVLTCILYLNPFWHEGDGAQLRFWPRSRGLAPEGEPVDVAPLHGRLVAFLCNSRNLHEVVPVTATGSDAVRVAISCWYYDSDRVPAVCAGQRTADAPGM